VLAATVVVGAIFGFAAYKILQVRRRKPTVRTEITGEEVEATEGVAPGEEGFVMYRGELWRARSASGLVKGRRYRVVSKDGPVLVIEEKS
jgi:membrane-bound ClpP family serine protease